MKILPQLAFLVLLLTNVGCSQTKKLHSAISGTSSYASGQYNCTYILEGAGENMIGEKTFSHTITINKILQQNDSVFYDIECTETIAAPTAIEDGDLKAMLATLGLNLKVTTKANGEYLDMRNKDEILKEIENNLDGYSLERRKSIVQNMYQADTTIFFEMMYELNYNQLIRSRDLPLSITGPSSIDSIIPATKNGPKTELQITKSTTQEGANFVSKEVSTYFTDGFENSQGRTRTFEFLPVHSTVTKHLTYDKSGMILRLEVNTSTERKGMRMKEGDKVLHEAEPTKEMMLIKFIKV